MEERLDQIFIPNYLASNQASNGPHYYVRGDGIMSNHHPISCVLEIVKTTQRTSMFQKMNTRFSRDVKERIHKIWKAKLKGVTFFTKLRKSIRFYREFCKVKAGKFCKEYELKQVSKCTQGSLQDMIQDVGYNN